MKKSLNKALKNYQEECQNMADTFIEWYYCDDDIKSSDVEWSWVADQVGGVLCVNDHFWSMNDLVEIFSLQPTESQLWDWKSECDEAAFRGKTSMNLRSWLKLNNNSK